jgi:hypothetical protein
MEPTEGRSPAVEITLGNGCVTARIAFTVAGDDQDMEQGLADLFFSELYQRCVTVARLHREHGIQVQPLIRDEVTVAESPPPAAPPPPEPAQMAMPLVSVWERDKHVKREIDERWAKSANGASPPRHQRSRAEVRREIEAVYTVLRQSGEEMRPTQILPQLPEWMAGININNLGHRLAALEQEGRITRRQELNVYQKPTFYRAVPREGEDQEGHTSHPLAAVLPWSRGKTFLIYGGQPGLSSRRQKMLEMEASFQLKACRWPEFGEDNELPEKLRELKPDVDLVVINRWNRTHITEIQREAQRLGIPVLRLTRGCNLAQIIEGLREQLPRLQVAPRERVAA